VTSFFVLLRLWLLHLLNSARIIGQKISIATELQVVLVVLVVARGSSFLAHQQELTRIEIIDHQEQSVKPSEKLFLQPQTLVCPKQFMT